MKILTIADKKENKLLRQKTKPFDFSKFKKKEILELIKKMRKIMVEANGIGLAANQLGLDYRLFVAQIQGVSRSGEPRAQTQTDRKFYAIFNPKVTKVSEAKEEGEEGCLSVPRDLYGIVKRHQKLTLEGQDQNGRKIKIKARGLLARIFQHEVDHLEGKLFIDRTKEVYKVKKEAEK